MHVKFATMHENEFTLQRRKKIFVNESLNEGVDICNKAYIQEVRLVDLLVGAEGSNEARYQYIGF